MRQESEYLKALGIAREYENQKAGLREREKALREHVSTLGHLLAESQHHIDTTKYIPGLEDSIRLFDTLLEDLYPKTLDTYRTRDAVGTVPSDWDAARKRVKHLRTQAEVLQDAISAIQQGVKDAFNKADAELQHIRNVKHTLERMQIRRVEIEKWAQEAKQEAEERKKQIEEEKDIYVNMMRKARNDLFGEKARWALRPDTAKEPGSGYQRVHHRPLPSGDRARDTKATNAADEAELESIYRQGQRKAAAPPDPMCPGTGAGLDAFRCAERFVQAKAVERVIKTEEQFIQTIGRARSKTQDAIEQLQSIYKYLNEIKVLHLNIAGNGLKLAESLKKGKYALERAVRAAENYARDAQEACNQQSKAKALLDRGDDAIHAQARARQTARQELEAYAQAKKCAADALRYLRAISAEYSNMEDPSNILMKHFADFLQGTLPFEEEVLDRALGGMKQIIKGSMRLLRVEEQAREAAHQTAIGIETGPGADTSQLTANEHEALLLAALANDALAGYAASYQLFHILVAYVASEQFGAMFETSIEQFLAALQMVKKDIDEMKQQKESKDAQRQTATLDNVARQAHLLIDERTGAIILKDGRAAFHLQDLTGIDEAPLQEHLSQSRLWFKGGRPYSSYDVAHDLLHEQCEARTRIHLQVPDGAGRQVAMLCLPNGTHINLADIDLEQTQYDPARPQGGVTITLKKDGQKINLLATASVMTIKLTQEALRELMDRSLDQSIHRLASAVGTKDFDAIEDAFFDTKTDDMHTRYIEKYILSSEDREKRQQDLTEWMQCIQNVTSHSVEILHRYADEVVSAEHGEKEITESTVLEQVAVGKAPTELFQKRSDCLQQIVRARGFDTIIHCQLFQDPDDSSAGTYLSPTVQEVLMEYERVMAFQQAQQWQRTSASGPSDKWACYLARLRRAIFDEAPAFFRTKLLIYHIREAVKADHWEQGTAENPGVAQLAKELQAGPSAVGEQDHHGDNDYASALHVFVQQAVAGIQAALKIADPAEILVRIDLLDLAFSLLYHAETRVWQALDPTTPTALAKEIVEQINAAQGRGIHDDGMSQQRASKQRQPHVRRPL